MIRLLKADLARLLRDRGMLIIALILVGVCFISIGAMWLLSYMIDSIDLSMIDNIDLSELGVVFSFSAEVGSMMIEMGAIAPMGLFTAIAVGLFNGADFKNYTVRNKITAGCSRDAIYLSALIVNQIINLALFLIAAIATLLFGAMLIDFKFASTFAGDFAMTFLISAAFTAVMTFLSFVTKKTSWTILIGVLVAFLAPNLFGALASYYFNLYALKLMGEDSAYQVLEWLSRLNIFSMNTFISNINSGAIEATFSGITWDGFNYNTFVGWLYGNAAITSLVWGGGATAGGMLLFRRTDIK